MNKIILLCCIVCVISLQAQEKQESKPIPEGKIFSSKQTVRIDGKTINLNAQAGTIQLRNDQNAPIALFGFTAYHKEGVNDLSQRPIVFAFNGGPGSSSFWLHMGVLGPKRIPINDPDYTGPAPYDLVNNEFSILDVADLVMIDPVGTGLSVPVGDKEFKDFWGVDQDIESISRFIRQYLIENNRMNSPKYLLGESYGTFRNAGIMAHMQDMGIAMNGVIMVSAVFDLRTLLFPPGEDISYIVHFPTYAATSRFHGLVDDPGESLDAFLKEIRDFTKNEYAPALFAGDLLSDSERQSIAEKLAGYTGLSTDYWLKANLRVEAREYFQETLRDKGKTVGRLDSRFVGLTRDLLGQFADYDPQSSAISPPYITGFLHYLYNDLGVDKDLHYQTSAGSREGFRWDWSHQGNTAWGAQFAINTGIDMARAMMQNPDQKVLILNGIYDLATVFYGVEYTLDHLGLSPEVRDNIIMKYYEAGHMMYTHGPSLEKFKKDVSEFILDTK